MRGLAASISAALVVTLAYVPGVAAGATGSVSGALAQLNAQRAANGIPAGLVEDPTLTNDCLAHDRYMAANHTLTHTEIAGNPGYTPGGAYAGLNAVLAQGADWSSGDPYEFAPLHLDQLLAPRLFVLGSADAEGFSCTTTFPGWARPDPATVTVYTYPGPGATIAPSEVAHELPWTPGDLVGIPQPARTGPNLVVLVDAPGQQPNDNPAHLAGASLSGPSGPLAVRTVDGFTPLPQGAGTLGPYISPGGFIIPLAPLAPGAVYHAHVVVNFAGQDTPHDWSFTSRGQDPQSALQTRGARLVFRSRSPQRIQVTFTRAGGAHAPAVTIRPDASARLRLSPGSWQACGQQQAGGSFDAYSVCIALTVTGRPTLRLSSPRTRASQLSLRLHYSAVLHGRPAMLTLTPLSLRCNSRRCHTVPGHSSVRTILLRSGSLLVPLPAAGDGIRVALTTAAFQLRDAPWTAAQATFRYLRP